MSHARTDRLLPAIDAQLLIDISDMALHRPVGDDQTLRNLLSAEPLGQQLEHLYLAARQGLDQG